MCATRCESTREERNPPVPQYRQQFFSIFRENAFLNDGAPQPEIVAISAFLRTFFFLSNIYYNMQSFIGLHFSFFSKKKNIVFERGIKVHSQSRVSDFFFFPIPGIYYNMEQGLWARWEAKAKSLRKKIGEIGGTLLQ